MDTNCAFPYDILEKILCMLPVRQLLRIRCVCKSWCAIVDNPIFVNKHHQNKYAILKQEGDIPLLFYGADEYFDRDTGPPIKYLSKRYGDDPLCLTPDLQRDRANKSKLLGALFFVGCVNGVVLLDCEVYTPHLALWNPATRDFKVVPYPCPRLENVEHSTFLSELGYDPKSNNFKIIMRARDDKHYWWEMYSLNTDSWKIIEDPSSCPTHDLSGQYFSGSDLCINNKYYQCNMGEQENLIISFDFYNEVFQVFDQPSIEGHVVNAICNYNGSLGLITTRILYDAETSPETFYDKGRLDIWVMDKTDDLGIPPLWKHIFTIGPYEGCWIHFCLFRVGGDVIITRVAALWNTRVGSMILLPKRSPRNLNSKFVTVVSMLRVCFNYHRGVLLLSLFLNFYFYYSMSLVSVFDAGLLRSGSFEIKTLVSATGFHDKTEFSTFRLLRIIVHLFAFISYVIWSMCLLCFVL